jgi:hypothetical protein
MRCLALFSTKSSIYHITINSNYDNIKWLGGTKLNLAENVLVRLAGYYFFQVALMTAFVMAELGDLDRKNENHAKSLNS